MDEVGAKLGLIIMLYCVQQLSVESIIASGSSLGKSLFACASVRMCVCACVCM